MQTGTTLSEFGSLAKLLVIYTSLVNTFIPVYFGSESFVKASIGNRFSCLAAIRHWTEFKKFLQFFRLFCILNVSECFRQNIAIYTHFHTHLYDHVCFSQPWETPMLLLHQSFWQSFHDHLVRKIVIYKLSVKHHRVTFRNSTKTRQGQ